MKACCPLLVAVALAVGTIPTQAQVTQPVTQFLGPIRAQNRHITTVSEEMQLLAHSADRDPAKIQDIGTRFRKEAQTFQTLLNNFCNGETRRGLSEEIDLLRESFATLLLTEKIFEGLTQGQTVTITQEDKAQLLGEMELFTSRELRSQVEEHLESQGLLEALGQKAFNMAVDRAVAAAEAPLWERVNNDVLRLLEVAGAARAGDLQGLLQERVQLAVARQVAKILVKITSSELIITFAAGALAGVLIRWIGPELQELLRERGNLRSRVPRSVGTLEGAWLRLNELRPEARISEVLAELENADEKIKATQFLWQDLLRHNDTLPSLEQHLRTHGELSEEEITDAMNAIKRFEMDKFGAFARVFIERPTEEVLEGPNHGQLLGRLAGGIGVLARTIHLTEHRFLLNKKIYQVDCDEANRELTRLIENIDDRLADGTATEVEYVEFPPQYLIHIIETKTPGGPWERDVWILFGGKPDENGILLTPDGTGGVFVNKTDQVRGPFTNSHQLCPALKEVGLEGAWVGQHYIRCEP